LIKEAGLKEKSFSEKEEQKIKCFFKERLYD
jgi:hypothetical protein